jgi:hypothetical protein
MLLSTTFRPRQIFFLIGYFSMLGCRPTPVPTTAPAVEPAPEQVIEQAVANEKALVPRGKSGKFVERNSEETVSQRTERAKRIQDALGDLAEAPITDLLSEQEIKDAGCVSNDSAMIPL